MRWLDNSGYISSDPISLPKIDKTKINKGYYLGNFKNSIFPVKVTIFTFYGKIVY